LSDRIVNKSHQLLGLGFGCCLLVSARKKFFNLQWLDLVHISVSIRADHCLQIYRVGFVTASMADFLESVYTPLYCLYALLEVTIPHSNEYCSLDKRGEIGCNQGDLFSGSSKFLCAVRLPGCYMAAKGKKSNLSEVSQAFKPNSQMK
jgi:hypothetical protein